MGGSNAQREVIADTLLQAYLRAGRYVRAEEFLRQRLARRPSARDTRWLQQAQFAPQTECVASALLGQAALATRREDTYISRYLFNAHLVQQSL